MSGMRAPGMNDNPACSMSRWLVLEIIPASATATTTTTGGGGTGRCTTAWKLDNSWQGGFQGALTVTNTGTSAANPWQVVFTLPAGTTVASGWNGTFTQSGTTVTVTAPSYSPSLGAGASVS